jgi:sugar lactone lactonase YvrE
VRAGERSPSVAAGFGPTLVVVGADDRIYVVDTAGGAVLLFRRGEELKLVRRAALPGRPDAAALDRERGKLWVALTQTDEIVQLTADGAPRVKRRLSTVRDPDRLAIEGDRLTVQGAGGRRQVIDLD